MGRGGLLSRPRAARDRLVPGPSPWASPSSPWRPTWRRTATRWCGSSGRPRAKGCRVVVFPETALYSPPETPRAEHRRRRRRGPQGGRAPTASTSSSASSTDATTRSGRSSGCSSSSPEGQVIHTYDKLWADARFNNAPGPVPHRRRPVRRGHLRRPLAPRRRGAAGRGRGADPVRVLEQLRQRMDAPTWAGTGTCRGRCGTRPTSSSPTPPRRTGRRARPGTGTAPSSPRTAAWSRRPARSRTGCWWPRSTWPRRPARPGQSRRNHPLFRPFWDVGLDDPGRQARSRPPPLERLRSPKVADQARGRPDGLLAAHGRQLCADDGDDPRRPGEGRRRRSSSPSWR